MKTIKKHDSGPAVEDVQKRLRILGFPVIVDGEFLDQTESAVRAFRQTEGLGEEGVVDEALWNALVDATFSMGDRMLYLRMPYFHGRDVKNLQEILEVLGFVPGGADGIFGAHTENALREFQASVGLVDDGVAGASTFDAIARLRHAWEGKSAPSESMPDHRGFARAATALEKMEVCFFGLDALACDIAHRAANLAQATTPFSCVTSAENLSVTPPESMIMIGLGVTGQIVYDRSPVVSLSEGQPFQQRFATALSVARNGRRRLYINIDGGLVSTYSEQDLAHWEQRIAVTILDALCNGWE